MSRRRVAALSGPGARMGGRLVEVGGMLFSSSIAGVDTETGQLNGEPAQQIAAAFRNLAQLMAAGGASTDDLGLVTVCVPDDGDRPLIDAAWSTTFPHARNRPARSLLQYPLPDGEIIQLQAIGVAGQARQVLEVPGLTATGPAPLGVRVGDVVFSSPICGENPATGRLVVDADQQVRQAFRNLEALVEQAGGTGADVAHIYIFVRDRADNDYTLEAFLDTFPTDADRPARKNIFADALRGGPVVAQIQVVAVLGQHVRRNFEVPGFSKKHPNPAGARVGNLLVSAGITGAYPRTNDVRQQAAVAFGHLRSVVEQAGGSPADIGLATIVLGDYADEPAVMEAWRELFPNPADEPACHVMTFGGRGQDSYQVQIHIMAALSPT